MDIQGMIFDMDGTLLDSMGMWRTIFPDYFSRYVSPEQAEAHMAEAETMNMDTSLALFVKTYSVPATVQELKRGLIARAKEGYAAQKLLPGAKGFLDQVASAHIPMAIASCTELELLDYALDCFGLTGYFDAVFSASMGYPSKSSPDIYLAAAEALGTDPGVTLVAEDALVAAASAKGAGFETLGLHWPSSRFSPQDMGEVCDVVLTCGWPGVTFDALRSLS